MSVDAGLQKVTTIGSLPRWGAVCGIAGPVALTIYFVAPAFANWPYAGAPTEDLIGYASTHAILFFAGAWFQATGALLSVLFFLVLRQLSSARDDLAGTVVSVAAALLLAVVLVEAALLVAVPVGAAAGDAATVTTTFTLSNGVFARVFPLAPAPLIFGGLGVLLLRGDVLPRAFAVTALGLAILFELAGIAAIFSTAGLIFAVAMSILQEIWIVAAAVALWRTSRTFYATSSS
jgi:hypothetical protein